MDVNFIYCSDADTSVAIPERQTAYAAGYDVRANLRPQDRTEGLIIEVGDILEVPTGLALAIPDGLHCEVRSRSGLAMSAGVVVLNSPGTVDPDYRGEILVLMANFGKSAFLVSHAMRIAQLVFVPFLAPSLVEVSSLSNTERSTNGFGSTGED